MKSLLAIALICTLSAVSAQTRQKKTLTLDDCLNAAIDNSIQIKQAKNGEIIARANRSQALMNFLPSVNAAVNYDWQFGTFFDNISDQIVTQRNSSNPGISANWNLFNGFSNIYTRRQRDNDLISAREDIKSAELGTKASILQLYLNVILAQENIKIGQERVDLLTAQLDRAEKRQSVGVTSPEEVYNFRSQLATEKLNFQNLQNTFERNKLLLLQDRKSIRKPGRHYSLLLLIQPVGFPSHYRSSLILSNHH